MLCVDALFPAEGYGAGQGVVLEVDDVGGKGGAGLAVGGFGLFILGEGFGLVGDEAGEGGCGLEGGEVGPPQVGFGCYGEGDEGGVGVLEDVESGFDIGLDVEVGGVIPLGVAGAGWVDIAAHEVEVGAGEDAGVLEVEEVEVGVGADGYYGGSLVDAGFEEIEGLLGWVGGGGDGLGPVAVFGREGEWVAVVALGDIGPGGYGDVGLGGEG